MFLSCKVKWKMVKIRWNKTEKTITVNKKPSYSHTHSLPMTTMVQIKLAVNGIFES